MSSQVSVSLGKRTSSHRLRRGKRAKTATGNTDMNVTSGLLDAFQNIA